MDRMSMRRLQEAYIEHKAQGVHPMRALEEADLDVRWKRAEERGIVRLLIEEDPYWEVARIPGDWHRIMAEGVWGMLAQYRESARDMWQSAAEEWGFIGESWKGSNTEHNLKEAALGWLEIVSREARECRKCK